MIYLFDKNEQLIKIIHRKAVKTAMQTYTLTTERYVSDRLTVEIKALNADEIERIEFMAIQSIENNHSYHYFYVAQKTSEDKLTTLIGVQSGIEELRKTVVYDKRPKNQTAGEVISDLLKDTNWRARFIGTANEASTTFYYISTFEALKKVCSIWDLEMQFFVEMNGNRIGARYIDFKKKIGQVVGKRVVYGHNALKILQEVERTNLFTALVGRGKGVQVSSAGDVTENTEGEVSIQQADGYGRKITFEDIVWSTTKGNPVDKPKGQKFLELPTMTDLYGIKNIDGSMRPKIGFIDFSEEEDPEHLIQRTYDALVDSARPQLTLKTSSVYLEGVFVGDTIRVVRHDKHLDYDTRIFEITFNRLNNLSSDIKLGDRIGGNDDAKIQSIAEKAVDDFVNNEFNHFVQNLSEFVPSADGFNTNWYSQEDPNIKYQGKVLINDIWFKPDPEHEGHTIMLRWTGEAWEEILRTYDSESLKQRIDEEVAQLNETMAANEIEHDKEVAEILNKVNGTTDLAAQAKEISNQIANDLAEEVARIANNEQNLVRAEASINKLKGEVSAKVSKNDFDNLNGRISNAETAIRIQAGHIEQRLTSTQVDKLINDKGYTTSQTVQNLIRETSDSFSRTISETRLMIPNPEDMVPVAAFNTVKDTVDSHNRTISDVQRNVSQLSMTSQGLISRVYNAESGLATVQNQLAGSWAVRNLTNSGTILNQLNLNRDGSVKIDGKLVQITGRTYIQDGVITSAKIGSLDAGKITTGTLNAANVNIINLNANRIVGLDANFIRSKIEYAVVDWLKGKTITAQNGAMQINLNSSKITFNSNATIEFNSSNNSLVRRKGTHTAFVHFNDVSSSSDGGVGSLYAAIGVTSSGDGVNSMSSGRFAGIRTFRGARGTEHNSTVDQTEIYGDKIFLKDSFTVNRGLTVSPVKIDKMYEMADIIASIKALWRCWAHLKNVGWNTSNRDFITAIVNESNRHKI